MTQDEIQAELGSALEERRELTREADCLRYRLRTYGRAFLELADDPFNASLTAKADKAPDLKADGKRLHEVLTRIGELNRLLDLREHDDPRPS